MKINVYVLGTLFFALLLLYWVRKPAVSARCFLRVLFARAHATGTLTRTPTRTRVAWLIPIYEASLVNRSDSSASCWRFNEEYKGYDAEVNFRFVTSDLAVKRKSERVFIHRLYVYTQGCRPSRKIRTSLDTKRCIPRGYTLFRIYGTLFCVFCITIKRGRFWV